MLDKFKTLIKLNMTKNLTGTLVLLLISGLTIGTNGLETSSTSTTNQISSESGIRQNLLKIVSDPSYNKEIRPVTNGMNATRININFMIRKIDRIDDVKMEITVQFTFRQTWKDEGLKFETNDPNLEYIVVDENIGSKIWTPDLFFPNEANSFVHNTMKLNSYKRIHYSGEIIWSSRITGTFTCPMNLKFFPFDKQICTIKLASFSATIDKIRLYWDDTHPIQSSSGSKPMNLARFNLKRFDTGYCHTEVLLGSFSCAYVDIHLERQSGMYIILLYAPTFMLVMLSWVSFWLGKAISARMSLTLTLLLTLATLTQGFGQTVPQVSYMKAIDLWTGVCMTFGLFTILECATISFILQNSNLEGFGNVVGSKEFAIAKDWHPMAEKLDRISRIVFPLCFIIFITVYVLVFVVSDNPLQTGNEFTDERFE